MSNTIDNVEVRRVELSSPDASALILRLNAELSAMYPEEGSTFFDLSEDDVAEGNGTFVIAWLGERAVGCGALRRLDDDRAEVKRMFTDPEVRGRRVAERVLDALEAEAIRLGVRTMVLETGTRQWAARSLYSRKGFEICPCWGKYADAPLSVCMHKNVS